jgi:predicted histidine transporter YuiF (NhaC family)
MLFVALAPMLVDVVLGMAGLHDATIGTRLITGALFGMLVPYVVMPVALGAVHEFNAHQPPITHLQKGSTDA